MNTLLSTHTYNFGTNGTDISSGSAWTPTDKTEIDNDLIQYFYQTFPKLKHISELSIQSDKRKNGLLIILDFKAEWHKDNKLNWNRE